MRVPFFAVAALVAAGLTGACDGGGPAGAPAPTLSAFSCSGTAARADAVTADGSRLDNAIDPPLTCHGDHNAVIRLDGLTPYDHLHVAVMAYSGDDRFGAEAYCADSFSHALAHVDGHPYAGSALVEHPPFRGERLHIPQLIDVEARGPWTITVVDLATMPGLDAGTTRGHGDAVLIVPPDALADGPASFTFTHNGGSNFIVVADDDHLSRDMTLINEIGPYAGVKTVPDGTEVIEITADGDWTIKRDPPDGHE